MKAKLFLATLLVAATGFAAQALAETGRVKWFNDAKGFGLIKSDNGGPDVFVYQTAIQMNGFRTLKIGQHVQFELKQVHGLPEADNVRPAPVGN